MALQLYGPKWNLLGYNYFPLDLLGAVAAIPQDKFGYAVTWISSHEEKHFPAWFMCPEIYQEGESHARWCTADRNPTVCTPHYPPGWLHCWINGAAGVVSWDAAAWRVNYCFVSESSKVCSSDITCSYQDGKAQAEELLSTKAKFVKQFMPGSHYFSDQSVFKITRGSLHIQHVYAHEYHVSTAAIAPGDGKVGQQ